MYEQPSQLCPVKLFELYLSKLHPKVECLWQRPKDTAAVTDNSWYCKALLRKNSLGNFMKNISRTANLSKLYTNHSIRATAVVLDHSNFEARHIMRVSSHKSGARIRSYSHRLSENTQRERSDTLGLAGGQASELEGTVVPSKTLELTSSHCEDALNSISTSPLQSLSLPSSPVFHATQTNTLRPALNDVFHIDEFNSNLIRRECDANTPSS